MEELLHQIHSVHSKWITLKLKYQPEAVFLFNSCQLYINVHTLTKSTNNIAITQNPKYEKVSLCNVVEIKMICSTPYGPIWINYISTQNGIFVYTLTFIIQQKEYQSMKFWLINKTMINQLNDDFFSNYYLWMTHSTASFFPGWTLSKLSHIFI